MDPAGLTNKQLKIELKERHAVVGGTRAELLERVRQLTLGTYVIQCVPDGTTRVHGLLGWAAGDGRCVV